MTHGLPWVLKMKIDIDRIFNFEDLEAEGLTNDLIRAIQVARKDLKLQMKDPIDLSIKSCSRLINIFYQYKDYIRESCYVRIINPIVDELFKADIELRFYEVT